MSPYPPSICSWTPRAPTANRRTRAKSTPDR